MSEDQKRLIREQLQANARMVQRNAERGVVYAHGQGPLNSERLKQAQNFLEAARPSAMTGNMSEKSGSDSH
jgi:hypothetical protein